MKLNYKIVVGIIFCLILGVSIYYCINNGTTTNKAIQYDGNTTYINMDDLSYNGTGVTKDGNSLIINYGGNYYINGTTNTGRIIVNTLDNKDVSITLDNVSIESSEAPIYIKQGDISITLINDNTLKYTKKYSESEEIDGALYSSDDILINGTGSLNISSTYDGIVSKDTLTIESGNYIINGDDDGIRGKDCVIIKDGTFSITSGGDGIKSTNEDDNSLGYIEINNGTFNISSTNDGIQAVTSLTINDGEYTIKTNNSSNNSSKNSGWGNNFNTSTDSAKGLKAGTALTINSGTFNLDTNDDSIHTNGVLLINNGTYNISSGDDGIHADTSLTIKNGEINITQSYEGIESQDIIIDGGNINVVASDDGINAGGGNDLSSMNRSGENSFNTSSNCEITINGGNINVNATGDGLDANGSIYINGGKTTINGPTDDGNGALDYDKECIVTDGILISSGSSGMLQAPSTSSKVNSLEIVFTSNITDTITIKDSNNNTILTFKPSKTSRSLVYTSTDLKTNEKYSVYIGDNLYKSATITSTVTVIGTLSNNMGGMMRR